MKVEGVESNPDCVEQSNKDGYFKFGALPPGEYSIVSQTTITSNYHIYKHLHKVPHYQQQEIVFEVVPDRVSVSVQNASVSIQVTIPCLFSLFSLQILESVQSARIFSGW